MSSSGETILNLLKEEEKKQLQNQQELLQKKIKETGDNLRNYNSWDYLCQFRPTVDGILSNRALAAKFDKETLEIFRQMQNHIPDLGSGYGYGVHDTEAVVRYGDMYTDFLKALEEDLPDIRTALVSTLKKEEDHFNAWEKSLDAKKDTFVRILVDELNGPLALQLNLPTNKTSFTEQDLVNALIERLKKVNQEAIQPKIDEILKEDSKYHISLLLRELGVRDKVDKLLDSAIKLQQKLPSSRDERRKNLDQAKENLDTIDKLIETIYRNQNKALKTAAEAVDHLVTTTNPNELEHAITTHLSKNERAINETTPQKQGSGWGRLTAMVSSEFKPLMTTSLASVRTYAHSELLDAEEIRFGTQGQRHHGKERVAPLFKLWLEVQQRHHVETYKSDHNGAEPSGAEAITHIYFNNLGVDRDDWEGKKESRLSEALHNLEKEHPNVAVISIPADKGIMSKSMLSKEGVVTNQRAKEILRAIATRGQDGEELAEIEGDKRDFYISPKIKALLGQSEGGGYDGLIQRLVAESFEELGLDDSRGDLSYSQLQGVFFHFSKFKLTDHIIKTLQPDSFNMSCKDAIDRGGVSSAYYNLMKSIELKQPMTKAEFNEALHAAPTLVKGRGMNHHAQIIWNAVDVYLQNPENNAPEWLSDWRFENCPKDKARESLTKTIGDSLVRLETKLNSQKGKSPQPEKNIAILIAAIETLEKTQSLIGDKTAKASAYSMLYQAALQTESLANKAIAFNESPNDTPAREAFEKASERYSRLQDKADKHYNNLGKIIGQFFKRLFKAESHKHDVKAKEVVKAHGTMKEKLGELKKGMSASAEPEDTNKDTIILPAHRL